MKATALISHVFRKFTELWRTVPRCALTFSSILFVLVISKTDAAPTLDIDPISPFVSPDAKPWYLGNYSSPGGAAESDADLTFRLFAPDGYNVADPGDARHPLIVFLHGAGSRSTNTTQYIETLESLRYWVLDEVQSLSPSGGAFVLAPKITTGNRDQWIDVPFNSAGYSADITPVSTSLELVLELVGGLILGGDNDFRTQIDPRRVYIVGQSMGGFGAWDAIARVQEFPTLLPSEYRPYRFAAGIASSGAGPTDRGEAFIDVPFWGLRHDDDTGVPAAGTDKMVAAIEAAGASPFFQTYPVLASGGFSTELSDILDSERLVTNYEGPFDASYSGPHNWTVSTWQTLGGQNNYVGQWLFAQQSIPEPGSFVLAAVAMGILSSSRHLTLAGG